MTSTKQCSGHLIRCYQIQHLKSIANCLVQIQYQKGTTNFFKRHLTQYSRSENSIDEAVALGLDREGNVYVAGTSTFGPNSIYTIIKYSQVPADTGAEKPPPNPNRFWLGQNYPNPFNPTTTIPYAIAGPQHVSLRIFNLAGQVVATLVNGEKPAGPYDVQWRPRNLPSGVYFSRLKAGNSVEIRKLILLQ